MTIYRIEDLIRTARTHSPYYRELYSGLPENETRLEALPVVSQNEFWEANTYHNNRLLTGPPSNGVIYKSGGTTGNPKLSFYLRDEWETFARIYQKALGAVGLLPGDRVGNLFYVGELYASFLFVHRALELSPVPVLQFPIGGATPLDSIAKIILEFGINVLAGMPTSLLNIADHLVEYAREHGEVVRLRKILFAGESMYPDQRAHLARLFPGIQINSLGCASVDAGMLGYADSSCGPDEHRAFGSESVLEIVDDDTGEPITEPGRPGRVLITNLIRLLMPIIRYPSGDRAEWVEPRDIGPDRKFRLVGRAEEGARIGPVTVYYDDVRPILAPFYQRLGVMNYQLRITHEQRKDQLSLVIGVQDPARLPETASREILAELHSRRPMLHMCEDTGKVHPTRIAWVPAAGLAVNSRTGKLRRVMDERM
ncbi:MAG TPA: hypothetical protein VGD80_18850 [Kofleriaceae bacterium]